MSEGEGRLTYINTNFKTTKISVSLQDIPPDFEPASTTTATVADVSFQQEFLYTHNFYRSKHSAPPLTLSEELNASAQKWADHLLKINALEYSGGQDGENMFFLRRNEKIQVTGKEVVDSWYDEVKKYDWGNPGFSLATGHFTQIVWKGNTELGVGMATDDERVVVVGHYRPGGNVSTDFPKNVLPSA